MSNQIDPVLAQRNKVRIRVSYGIRSGTLLFSFAMVLFFLGFMTRFTSTISLLILICLITGSIALAPALVFHYGVKAADREDRRAGR